ncbi:MAG: hypothetical protein AAF628_24985 [Planctomycetota bacterium]
MPDAQGTRRLEKAKLARMRDALLPTLQPGDCDLVERDREALTIITDVQRPTAHPDLFPCSVLHRTSSTAPAGPP